MSARPGTASCRSLRLVCRYCCFDSESKQQYCDNKCFKTFVQSKQALTCIISTLQPAVLRWFQRRFVQYMTSQARRGRIEG